MISGFLPEGEIHSRAGGSAAPYEMGHDPGRYPLARIVAAAEMASHGGRPSFSDPDAAVRYWAAQGYLIRGEVDDALRAAAKDSSPCVRAVAAEALGRYGNEQDLQIAVAALMPMADVRNSGVFVALAAVTALDAIGRKAAAALGDLARLPREAVGVDVRYQSYLRRLIEKAISNL